MATEEHPSDFDVHSTPSYLFGATFGQETDKGPLPLLTWIYSMLRDSASGPEIGLPGQILAGLLPGKH